MPEGPAAVGPIEVIVVAFPGNQFNGRILPELKNLVEAGTVRIVDGILAIKAIDGTCTFVEMTELAADDPVGQLAALFDQMDDLISEEDLIDLMEDLEPDSSAAVLVFEHTWVKPLRDAIVGSGGILAANIRIPPETVAEVMSALADAN